jgi:septal ring factor EnvC (AmiA/AmiB activator)
LLAAWPAHAGAGPSTAAASGARTPAAAAPAAAAAPSLKRQQALQAERRELQARLAALKKSLTQAESAQSEATDALAESETAISAANRHLQQLAQARREVRDRIEALHGDQRGAERARDAQGRRLAAELASRWRLALMPAPAFPPPPSGADPALQGPWLEALARSDLQGLGELHRRQDELAAQESETLARQSELTRIDAEERKARAQLLRQQLARRATLARLAKDIAVRRESVARLERDDSRLSSVIGEIGRLLAEQARRHAGPKGPAAAEAAPNADIAATRFGRQRGQLVLPVAGEILAHFGSPRLGADGHAQTGAPAWKGVFLAAATGTPVHAVAAGRVVFADWLRGFGNLLIVDHGEGFLSVYANNESLLRAPGDGVAADEAVATAGNTGGNPRAGLYFELRFHSHPLDPMAWARARPPGAAPNSEAGTQPVRSTERQ